LAFHLSNASKNKNAMRVKFILIGCLCCVLTVVAQKGKHKLQKAERQAKEERQRSFGGKRTESDLKDEKQKLHAGQGNKTTDLPASAESNRQGGNSNGSKELVQRNADQPNAQNKNTSDSSGNQSTPPVVIQRTTSESGSPSILAGDNGRERDGTNNVQRSSINVAGSTMRGNLNLDEKNRSEQNQKTDSPRIQKQEEVPNAASPNSKANTAKGDRERRAKTKTVQKG
jgi:hypothetical protein